MSVKFKESTQWYSIFYIETAIATVVYSQKVTTNRDHAVSINMNDTLYKGC